MNTTRRLMSAIALYTAPTANFTMSSGPAPVLLTLRGKEPFSRHGRCNQERVIIRETPRGVRFSGPAPLVALATHRDPVSDMFSGA